MSRTPTGDSPSNDDRRWDVTWEDVERAQIETMLSATPAQRLAWLEEAMRLALVSGALEARRESSAATGLDTAGIDSGGDSPPGYRRSAVPPGS